jgi:hypothetical protein
MSSANCPFSIFPKKDDPESSKRKDKYVTIDIPLDPSDPHSQKISHEYQKLNSTEIEEIIHFKRTSLSVLNRRALVRFAENLVLICSHQLEAPDTASKMPLGSPIFWVLLHRVIEFEENRIALAKKNERASQSVQNAMRSESEEDGDEALPCSILFLISAHDLLGKHSWCMLDNGVFVLYLLEVKIIF